MYRNSQINLYNLSIYTAAYDLPVSKRSSNYPICMHVLTYTKTKLSQVFTYVLSADNQIYIHFDQYAKIQVNQLIKKLLQCASLHYT